MKLDDFRLLLRGKEFVPIIIGGMGVNISTAKLALESARLGGIGHISDAEVNAVADQRFGTSFVSNKKAKYSSSQNNRNKAEVQFDLEELAEAQKMHVSKTMEEKKGTGAIFLNCMEKLTMNNPLGTLKTRLSAAMEAGIDGITLSAGLHLRSFELVQDNPRFYDTLFGIIVSSVQALKIFLQRASRVGRLPDYIVVEGPLAGGHLGFNIKDWREFNLKTITNEVLQFLKNQDLQIPVVPAGGVFTGTDAVEFLQSGASAVQVATRFTVTKESGLPDYVKQRYFQASEEDVVVNTVSPTGYPMRMLKQSPVLKKSVKPNCEGLGYLLDSKGDCSYLAAYHDELEKGANEKISIMEKVCLCTGMFAFRCWTCGHYVYRLKDTTNKLLDGTYQLLTAEHVFKDYQFSEDHKIRLPELELEFA
ncbi:nitronate monooxygenase [bacterium]|nr:nitronate monooxygenase [bacterium]